MNQKMIIALACLAPGVTDAMQRQFSEPEKLSIFKRKNEHQETFKRRGGSDTLTLGAIDRLYTIHIHDCTLHLTTNNIFITYPNEKNTITKPVESSDLRYLYRMGKLATAMNKTQRYHWLLEKIRIVGNNTQYFISNVVIDETIHFLPKKAVILAGIQSFPTETIVRKEAWLSWFGKALGSYKDGDKNLCIAFYQDGKEDVTKYINDCTAQIDDADMGKIHTRRPLRNEIRYICISDPYKQSKVVVYEITNYASEKDIEEIKEIDDGSNKKNSAGDFQKSPASISSQRLMAFLLVAIGTSIVGYLLIPKYIGQLFDINFLSNFFNK
jgi:hypothetical protein